jgi:hypothetical protein
MSTRAEFLLKQRPGMVRGKESWKKSRHDSWVWQLDLLEVLIMEIIIS